MRKWTGFLAVAAGILCLCACAAGSGETAPTEGSDTLAFSYGDVTICPGDPAQAVLEALGEPGSYQETPSCAGEGMDKTYGYGGFYLTTYPEGETDRIGQIWFADDTVSTAAGIRIGSLMEQVKRAYPQGSVCAGGEQDFYFVSAQKGTLSFTLENGRVTQVQYQGMTAGCPAC